MKMTGLGYKTLLQNISEAGNYFDPAACFVGVATNITDNGQATTLADVTEGTGDMGLRVAITGWGDPYKLTDGRWAIDSNLCTFRPADNTEGGIFRSFFVATLATLGVLKAYGNLPAQYTLVDENSSISFVLRLTIDPSGRWDANVAWNG